MMPFAFPRSEQTFIPQNAPPAGECACGCHKQRFEPPPQRAQGRWLCPNCLDSAAVDYEAFISGVGRG